MFDWQEKKRMPQGGEEEAVYEFSGLKERAYSLTQGAMASTLDGIDYNAGKVYRSLHFIPHHLDLIS